MTEPNDLPARLAAIRADFIADLPNRAAGLRGAWAQVQASDWQGAPLQELHRLTHSLSGAGATFGCAELSERARALEEQLQRLLQGDPGADRDRAAALYAALHAAIATANADR